MRIRLAVAVAFTVLLVVGLLVPSPGAGRLMGTLSNLLHAPAFAVLAVVAFRALAPWSDRHRLLAATTIWVLAAGLGTATELLQALVGRNPGWQDLMANALGAGAGILWVLRRPTTTRYMRLAATVAAGLMVLVAETLPLLVLVDAWRQRFEMPQLASFESPLEMTRWTANESRLRRVPSHATDGRWALRVELEPGLYPGAVMHEPLPDWSAYRQLVFDVELKDGPPLDLIVKITDEQHTDWYYDCFCRTVRLSPGRRQVRIDLAEVASAPRTRQMDMTRISILQLFTVKLDRPRTLYLDNIRLRK